MCLEDSEPNHFTQHHARLALAIADQAAVAIENARLYKEMEWAAAVEERQRLARDLHDSVSQALYGIILGALTLSDLLGPTNSRVAEALQYLLLQAQTALDETRALILELRPETLQRNGLTSALGTYAGYIQANHNITIHTSFCTEPDISIGAKEAFYRITQQALQNVVQHAQTGLVEISLDCRPGETVLEIRDHGQGFRPEAVPPSHLGLRSMRERMSRQGGSVDIISSPGAGTIIRARMPTA
jgi:signal transduction histidine kinase